MPTRRCFAPTATPGRCRTCRCSTNWSTCWAPTSRPTTAAERERKAEAEYAAGVLDLMISREDLMDDEDHLLATGPALRRGPGRALRRARHPRSRRTRGRRPGLDLPARRGRRGSGAVRDGLAGADAALPEPILHGRRRSRPAPVGGRGDIVGHDAGAATCPAAGSTGRCR